MKNKYLSHLNITLSELYEEKRQVVVFVEGRGMLNLNLVCQGQYTCMLSAYKGTYCRETKRGESGVKYKSITQLDLSIKKLLKNTVYNCGEITYALKSVREQFYI